MPPRTINAHPAVRCPRLGDGGGISRSTVLIVSLGAIKLRPVRRCLRPIHMKITADAAVKAASWRCSPGESAAASVTAMYDTSSPQKDHDVWITSRRPDHVKRVRRLGSAYSHAFQLWWWGVGMCTGSFTWVHGRAYAETVSAGRPS